MAAPRSVRERTVIIGGGLHGAVVAATFAACGKPPPIVVERRLSVGGIFGDLAMFRMNSATKASVRSVTSPGPTRVPSLSPADDLNWIPNAPWQVSSATPLSEYPDSTTMARLIREILGTYSELYTDASMIFDKYGDCYSPDGDSYYGKAARIIFAGGLAERPDMPEGPAIMSGYAFMKTPVRDLAGKKIALIGGGDTAAQCAEYAVGQGMTQPSSFPDSVDWYGGESMPTTKETWMRQAHTRWALIGHHLPDRNDAPSAAVFRPYTERGQVANLGKEAWVNGQVYDLAIMATGFVPAPCPVTMNTQVRVGDQIVARMYDDGSGRPRIFRVGTAAELNALFKPYKSRYAIPSQQAIYNLAPRTAAFAASLS